MPFDCFHFTRRINPPFHGFPPIAVTIQTQPDFNYVIAFEILKMRHDSCSTLNASDNVVSPWGNAFIIVVTIDNIRPMDWKHITCAHIF